MSTFSKKIIGIDLGTTYCCLACWTDDDEQGQGAPIVIPTSSGERTMPSWVSFSSDGKVVGAAAKAQASSNAANTVYDVKRILGRSYNDPVVQHERKALPYTIVQGSAHGEPKLVVTWRNERTELNPEQVSAMILFELKAAACRHFGMKDTSVIMDAVITVPAHFNNQQRQATKDAGRIAGLNVRRIINEPTAAALAYGLHEKKTSNSPTNIDKDGTNDDGNHHNSNEDANHVVIFDLGGGTFDVTCLTMNEGVLEVQATGGDTHLGGEDFDNNMVEWCLTKLEEQQQQTNKHNDDEDVAIVTNDIRQSNRSMSRLRRAVENAKKNLSSMSSVDIEVDCLWDNVDFSATLTRKEFEEMNADLFQKCLDTVKDVLADAKVELDDVSDVVLVGGSTRIPFLQSSLSDMFGGRIDLCKSVHPDEAVAIGAAVQGHILACGGTGGAKDMLGSSMSTDLLLLDVTPLSLGIELEGKVMSTLIKRNTAIPCKKTRTYTTVDDWQTSIDVVVFEGERPHVDANHRLGAFVIHGVQRARAGEAKVDVSFSLDSNGILSVSARDQVTGAEAAATIKAERGRLTEEEVERMIADAERYRAQDEELAVKMGYKSALEEALFTAQSKAMGDSDMVELENLMDWLELDSDSATLEEMQERGRMIEDKFGIIVST